MSKYGLGRGLSSLIPKKSDVKVVYPIQNNEDDIVIKEKVVDIRVEKIKSNPWQPRTNFIKEKSDELVNSIREHGIIQPLILTKTEDGYELVAGERRLKAAKILGMFKVPAIIRDIEDIKKLELALIENVQRSNLNLLEESRAYHRLMTEFSLTQEEVAQKVGKSRSNIANILRLENLPASIKKYLNDERISFGHAKLLLALENEKKQKDLLKKILVDDLNVRDTENEVKKVSVKAHKRAIQKDPNLLAQEEALRNYLNTKVKIKDKKGKGSIDIEYYSKEELGDILEKILE